MKISFRCNEQNLGVLYREGFILSKEEESIIQPHFCLHKRLGVSIENDGNVALAVKAFFATRNNFFKVYKSVNARREIDREVEIKPNEIFEFYLYSPRKYGSSNYSIESNVFIIEAGVVGERSNIVLSRAVQKVSQNWYFNHKNERVIKKDKRNGSKTILNPYYMDLSKPCSILNISLNEGVVTQRISFVPSEFTIFKDTELVSDLSEEEDFTQLEQNAIEVLSDFATIEKTLNQQTRYNLPSSQNRTSDRFFSQQIESSSQITSKNATHPYPLNRVSK